MNFIDRWQERRNREWWARHDREHRWDALADYNSRVSKGIVHTPEYVERMAEEQAVFDLEHYGGRSSGFPITLEPRP